MTITSNENKHLLDLGRNRIPEDRDLEEGLRLNRNERVDSWPKDFLMEVFKNKPDYYLSIYPDLSPLYKKISNFCNVKEGNLLVTSGIDGALKTIWEVSTKESDSVGVLGPTYAMYGVYSRIFKTVLTEITYDPHNLKLKWKDLIDFITSKPKVVFIPNPNQPIEDALSRDQLATIAERTKNNNTLFVVDEAYYMFGGETGISLLREFDNVIILPSISNL